LPTTSNHAIDLKRWGDQAMSKLGDRGRQITGVGLGKDKEAQAGRT